MAVRRHWLIKLPTIRGVQVPTRGASWRGVIRDLVEVLTEVGDSQRWSESAAGGEDSGRSNFMWRGSSSSESMASTDGAAQSFMGGCASATERRQGPTVGLQLGAEIVMVMAVCSNRKRGARRSWLGRHKTGGEGDDADGDGVEERKMTGSQHKR
uniref:Uncharacterized protein n=1 Tax=Setaria italica TaxID=4555 RepID=K3XRX4_SETIT